VEPVFARPPSTKYQAMAFLLWLLARHANVDPPLTQMSRALQRADSFAHGVLKQLFQRRTSSREHAPARGVDFRSTLRWFAPGGTARASRARARYRELEACADSYVQGFEGFICFHIHMGSTGPDEQRAIVRDVLSRIAAGGCDVGRLRWLRSLLQHAMLDHGLAFEEDLSDPAVACQYEPADHLFQLATGLATQGAPPEALSTKLRAIRSSSVEQFVLAAHMLVVRMGALPGMALVGRGYLRLLERDHGDLLRRVPAQACAAYAEQFDYGGFADVLRARGNRDVDVLPLLESALCLVGRGETRRRRGADDGGFDKEDARRVTRLYSTWGLAHECCRLLAPAFDVRNEDSEMAREVAALARLLSESPLNETMGELVLTELFPGPFERIVANP